MVSADDEDLSHWGMMAEVVGTQDLVVTECHKLSEHVTPWKKRQVASQKAAQDRLGATAAGWLLSDRTWPTDQHV